MKEQELQLIRDIAGAVGSNAEFVVGQYSRWMVVSSVGWMIVGLAIMYAATKLVWGEHSEIAPWGQKVIKGVVIFIGILFFFCNLPDLFAPQAAAIHQLIMDVS